MHVSEKKRLEYWNHFLAKLLCTPRRGWPANVTGNKLVLIRDSILNDSFFWLDIIDRHGGENKTPIEMMRSNFDLYQHCEGNFWGMINSILQDVNRKKQDE